MTFPPQLQTAPAICQTPECIHAASQILFNLDPNHAKIDPCTNFDDYVCGGWRERNDMRPDQGSIFAGTSMEETAQTRLRHILEASEAPDQVDAGNFKKLKDAYNACLDEVTLQSRGAEPLIHTLAELQKVYSQGKTAASDSGDHLTEALLFLQRTGTNALISAGITVSIVLFLYFGSQLMLTLSL